MNPIDSTELGNAAGIDAGRANIADPSTHSRRLVAALAEAFPPDRIVRTLDALLEAETISKSGNRLPDSRTRLAAASLLLGYTIGLPVQRTESVNVNLDADSVVGLRERLKSPALRATLRKEIELAEDTGSSRS